MLHALKDLLSITGRMYMNFTDGAHLEEKPNLQPESYLINLMFCAVE